MVSLRRAIIEDLDEIVVLLNYLSPSTPEQEKEAATFWRILEDTNALTIVAEHKDFNGIVGVGTLYMMDKLLRGGSTVGQIEDVVVDPACRGLHIGKAIIDKLVHEANKFDCYKVVLNCSDENVLFYEKCGFHKHEQQMRKDLDIDV